MSDIFDSLRNRRLNLQKGQTLAPRHWAIIQLISVADPAPCDNPLTIYYHFADKRQWQNIVEQLYTEDPNRKDIFAFYVDDCYEETV